MKIWLFQIRNSPLHAGLWIRLQNPVFAIGRKNFSPFAKKVELMPIYLIMTCRKKIANKYLKGQKNLKGCVAFLRCSKRKNIKCASAYLLAATFRLSSAPCAMGPAS